jgi:hypothetical protein
MDPLKIEAESAYHRQVLAEEGRLARSLIQAAGDRHSFPLGLALSILGLAINLAVRLRDWYLAGGAQGYLPNLHID